MKLLSILAAAALLAALVQACGTAPSRTSVPPATEPALDGYARLGTEVVPLRYELDLRIDPASERFSGRASIEIEIREATPTIRLHAADMHFRSASVEENSSIRSIETELGPNGALRLRADPPFAAGTATLRFEW